MNTSASVSKGTWFLSLSGNVQKVIFALFTFVAIGFSSADCFSQQTDQVTIMCYNLLGYPVTTNQAALTADTALRNPFFRTSIASANPDILVTEEITAAVGISGFLSNVMNAPGSTYSAGTFIDGYDTDNGIFYKTSKFHFVSNTAIKTALRNISEFKLVHILSGDTFRIYAVHLKASAGSGMDSLRFSEVDSLRKVTNALPAGSNFIVCGDFNFYSANDRAYQRLKEILSVNDEGYFIDPISMTGTWNNSNYAIRHTQSTRTRSFGDGSNGGLDDRFDLILYSKAIGQPGGMDYVPNSQIPYGNDGNHYNDSINHPPNTAVSQTVANALHYGSDHLPVKAGFTFQYGAQPLPDVGSLSLVAPAPSICSNANQQLIVRVKNYASDSISFVSHNLQVILQGTNPSSVVKTFSKTISTGGLAAGAVMDITFDSTYYMTSAGNYTFNSNTVMLDDVNASNNSMPSTVVIVTAYPVATVSPAGPISICPSSSIALTASSGSSYLWSTGAVSQSINVSSAGNFTVTVINGSCSSVSSPVSVSINNSQSSSVLFRETMGGTAVVPNNTPIATYQTNHGFDNVTDTMSGSGDVRTTAVSSGYATASGSANVFLTKPGLKNFIISGINTSGLSGLQLSFGVWKSTGTSTGASDLKVMVSSNGTTYSNLSYTPLTSGSTWYYRTAIGTIPSVSNLRIQFQNGDTTTQFRIDDVLLTYVNSPTITANGSTSFCTGDSVTLTASSGNNYLWSSGATTQNIIVKNSGSYSVTENCVSSSPVNVTVTNCGLTLNLRVFISGLYTGSHMMIACADPVNHPTICDTITVQLADSLTGNIIDESKSVIDVSGYGTFFFQSATSNKSYYIIIRHRNSLETWSKDPVLFNTSTVQFDFTN